MARHVPRDEPQDGAAGHGPSEAGDTYGSSPPPARSARPASRRSGPRREYSAGGVVLRRIGGVDHILLIRDPYKNWGLPKGHVEDGEEPREAALREVREETGLTELELGPPLGTIDWFFRMDGRLIHKYCQFFVMRSDRGEVEPEVDEGITECVWVPADDAAARVTYDNAREMVVEAVRRIGEDGAPT